MTREGAALAAIRAKCLECSGGSRREANGCRLKNCPLWLFRGGEPRPATKPKAKREDRQLSMFDGLEAGDGPQDTK